MSNRPNAADPRQVDTAERQDKRRQAEFVASLRALLRGEGTAASNRFVVRTWLEERGVFRSPLHPNGSQLYYNVGQQDAGRHMLAQIVEADDESFLAMEAEARLRAKREEQERLAMRTRRVTERVAPDEETEEELIDG